MIEPMASPNVHETVLGLLEDLPRKKALDMGAGKGLLAKKLLEMGFKVDGCDIKKWMKVRGVKFFNVDLNKELPFKSKSYSLLTCVEVIEHIENPWQLIREMHRILKPGGYLILSTPNMYNWYARLIFLFTNRLPMFFYNTFIKSGHITPIFLWNLERMIEKKFKIERIEGNRSFIPLLGIPLPFRGKFFAEVVGFRLKRLK